MKDGTTPETNSLVQLAKDYLNIELNFLWMVPNDQLSERLALQFSSGELPDIVMLDSENFYEFLDSDYLRDLTDAYNNDASDDVKNILNMLGEAPCSMLPAMASCMAFPLHWTRPRCCRFVLPF